MPQNQPSGSELRPVTPGNKYNHAAIKQQQQQHQPNIFVNDNGSNPPMNHNEMETVNSVLNENR